MINYIYNQPDERPHACGSLSLFSALNDLALSFVALSCLVVGQTECPVFTRASPLLTHVQLISPEPDLVRDRV